jgi:CheY-like chemotaxis protein
MPTDNEPAPQPAINDERSHFLAHMGHDLRAPMTNILALTEALLDGVYGPVAPAQSETLKHIRDNGHRMINMVTDLVDLARIETAQLKLEPASTDIMEAFRQGLEMLHGQAKSKQVTIEPAFVPRQARAHADARRLRQLASALASAAVVSAPAAGRVMFRVEALPSEGRVHLEIRTCKRSDQSFPTDNSHPDAAASAAALLRLRKLSSVAVTMMEKLVELHQGSMAVTDFGSSGYSVRVALPLVFQEATAKPVAATNSTAADAASNHRAAPFILLADDEEIIRRITKDYLESVGYRVACVTNGREALDFLEVEVPDLLIMDMQMPLLDGMEALAELRRSPNPRIAKTPVVSLSGLVAPGHRERCLAAGANGCLAKPFGIKDLERVIHEFLGDSNSGGESR